MLLTGLLLSGAFLLIFGVVAGLTSLPRLLLTSPATSLPTLSYPKLAVILKAPALLMLRSLCFALTSGTAIFPHPIQIHAAPSSPPQSSRATEAKHPFTTWPFPRSFAIPSSIHTYCKMKSFLGWLPGTHEDTILNTRLLSRKGQCVAQKPRTAPKVTWRGSQKLTNNTG